MLLGEAVFQNGVVIHFTANRIVQKKGQKDDKAFGITYWKTHPAVRCNGLECGVLLNGRRDHCPRLRPTDCKAVLCMYPCMVQCHMSSGCSCCNPELPPTPQSQCQAYITCHTVLSQRRALTANMSMQLSCVASTACSVPCITSSI